MASFTCRLDRVTKRLRLERVKRRLPIGKVLVAIANKHARQLWAMLARDEDYEADAWLRHPMLQRPASRKGQAAAA